MPRLRHPLLMPLWTMIAFAALAAAKDPVAGCSVRVDSRYPELARRMETGIRRAVEADPTLDLRPSSAVSGYRVTLDAVIACPVDLFNGMDTAYARITGPGDALRTLCLSYPSRPVHDLGPDEQENLIAAVSTRVVAALKERAGLLPGGRPLEPGLYANREEIHLGGPRPLQVELLRDPAEIRLEESALLDPPRWEYGRTRLLDQAPPTGGKPPLDSMLASTTDPARSFDLIRTELPGLWDRPGRAMLLRELALMYREAGDRDEALWFARRCRETQDGPDRRLENAIEGPASRPPERLRRSMSRAGLSLGLRLGVEYDDNIMQDALNTPDPRDRKDWTMLTGISLLERWPFKLGPIANETSYDLHTSFHAKNDEFDLVAHDVGHDFVLRHDFGRDHLRLSAGGHVVFLRHKTSPVLNEKGWLLSCGYYLDAWRTYWLAEGWSKTLEHDRSFPMKTELDGTRDRIDLSVMHRPDRRHDDLVQVACGLQDDRPHEPTSRFRERSLLVKWHNSHVPPFLTSLSLYYVLAGRSYAAAEHGRVRREDSRQEYGMNLHRSFDALWDMDIDLSWVDNNSTRSSDEYRRGRISLSWRYRI